MHINQQLMTYSESHSMVSCNKCLRSNPIEAK
jgi:hypothetical protein